MGKDDLDERDDVGRRFDSQQAVARLSCPNGEKLGATICLAALPSRVTRSMHIDNCEEHPITTYEIGMYGDFRFAWR